MEFSKIPLGLGNRVPDLVEKPNRAGPVGLTVILPLLTSGRFSFQNVCVQMVLFIYKKIISLCVAKFVHTLQCVSKH